MQHGYEPSRLTHLMREARRAAAELDGIRSADPAAADAMVAVAELATVIADRIIPATTTVVALDPLGGTTPSVATLVGADWYAKWLRNLVVTDFSDSTDDELFAELERLEGSLPYDENIEPDLDDPFWVEFEQLSIELAVRAETDLVFADRLADQAVDTFLIPLALRFARFAPEVVADMLITVSEWPSWNIDLQSNYRTFAAALLVDFLVDFPDVALDILVDPAARRGDDIGLLEDLLLWPRLDHDAVTRFLDAAMSVPFERPELLPQAGGVLRQLVEIANGRSFPDGLPPELSPVVAKIVTQFLPFFVTSLNERGDVHLKDFQLHDIGVELGSYGDVLDLFGVLLRDPTSLEVLVGVIPALTLLGQAADEPLEVDLDDVANYLQALRKAAENEQLEEILDASRHHEMADFSIDLIFGAIDLITSVLGPFKAVGGAIPITVVKAAIKLFADWAIEATDLGLNSVATFTYLLMVYGIGLATLRNRDDHGDEDEADSENELLAETILDQIESALSTGRSIDEVEGLVGDLHRVLADIDSTTTDILDDARVVPPEYDVEANVDTER